MMSERVGVAKTTYVEVEKGDPSVALIRRFDRTVDGARLMYIRIAFSILGTNVHWHSGGTAPPPNTDQTPSRQRYVKASQGGPPEQNWVGIESHAAPGMIGSASLHTTSVHTSKASQ
jgi:hypothetical protein